MLLYVDWVYLTDSVFIRMHLLCRMFPKNNMYHVMEIHFVHPELTEFHLETVPFSDVFTVP